jgi:arylformamidase
MIQILLSYYIDNDSPYYIGTGKPQITPNNQIDKGDDYNTYTIKVENHCGTHVDAPRHFISTGRRISEYCVEDLTFENPVIIKTPKGPGELIEVDDLKRSDLDGADCLFFKTGFGNYREEDRNKYLTQNPGISPEAVQWLRENHQTIKCIGIDSISISRYKDDVIAKETHITAFKRNVNCGDPLLLIEDMKLHDKLLDGLSLTRVTVVPWQINGIDSAPCTVIAELYSI